MSEAAKRGVRFSPTVVLILVVLALAGGALISSILDSPVPGTLRLGVLAGEPQGFEEDRGDRVGGHWIQGNGIWAVLKGGGGPAGL